MIFSWLLSKLGQLLIKICIPVVSLVNYHCLNWIRSYFSSESTIRKTDRKPKSPKRSGGIIKLRPFQGNLNLLKLHLSVNYNFLYILTQDYFTRITLFYWIVPKPGSHDDFFLLFLWAMSQQQVTAHFVLLLKDK